MDIIKIIPVIIFFSISTTYAQNETIIGIYKLDISSPSRYYISLDCDSNYHFIIHYDLGGRRAYEPALDSNVRWHLDKDSILTLPGFSSKKKKFKVETSLVIQEIQKKETFTWRKVISYNEACDATSYTMLDSPIRDVYHFIPNKQVIRKESFNGNILTERIIYYELSQVEIDSLMTHRPQVRRIDPVDKAFKLAIPAMSYLIPMMKFEKWEDEGYEIIEYKKSGEVIKE